jgi:hypothetical protein
LKLSKILLGKKRVEENKEVIFGTVERVIKRGESLNDILENCEEMTQFIPTKPKIKQRKSVHHENSPLLSNQLPNQNKKCCSIC